MPHAAVPGTVLVDLGPAAHGAADVGAREVGRGRGGPILLPSFSIRPIDLHYHHPPPSRLYINTPRIPEPTSPTCSS